MSKALFEYTPIRDMKEEPVFLKPTEGEIDNNITSVSGGRKLFPASVYKDGIIAVITAEKGVKLSLAAENAPIFGAPEIIVDSDNKKAEVMIQGSHFSDYVFDQTINKPYFGKIVDNAGNSFTRLDFETKEHPHHRSLFIAVGSVNGVDCWNEYTDHGYIRNESITDVLSNTAYATFTANNRWTDHSGAPLIHESTKYTVYNQSDECRTLDLEITFTAKYGKVTFGATKEAGPLGIRMRDDLRVDIGHGILENSWGGIGESECWSRSAEWCDYHGILEGIGTMGITVFDCALNERYPTAWHIRNYGLFAANNLYFKGGFDIEEGSSITYKYRILFRRRPMDHSEISDRYVMYTINPVI